MILRRFVEMIIKPKSEIPKQPNKGEASPQPEASGIRENQKMPQDRKKPTSIHIQRSPHHTINLRPRSDSGESSV